MAFTGRSSEFACGFLLLLAALVPWLPPPPATEAPVGGGEEAVAALAQAVADWRTLWTAVDENGEAALEPDIQSEGLRAAGDTLWMRYPGLARDVDPAARHRFQLIALSNDARRKQELLISLKDHHDPRVRQRAWLESARVALRADQPGEAALALERALAEAVPEGWQADTWLMMAVVALADEDRPTALAALDTAIALDPGFWDARQLRLRVSSEALTTRGLAAADCLNLSQRLLEDLGALPTLAESHEQFRVLADRFATLEGRGHPVFALLAGLAYHWVGDNAAARETLRLEGDHGLPPDCAAELLSSGRQLRARLTP